MFVMVHRLYQSYKRIAHSIDNRTEVCGACAFRLHHCVYRSSQHQRDNPPRLPLVNQPVSFYTGTTARFGRGGPLNYEAMLRRTLSLLL
ncbi:hypothetical protein R3I93_005358 [Phoxinus phoxinus]|uniref:Uncharacterized protein n=1 Tax=Phoxinus phoxinus TaxID=58324 RepID=A0AAN9HAI7_9TELE